MITKISSFSISALCALALALTGCAHRLERPRLPDVFVDPPPAGQTNGTYTLAVYKTDFEAYTTATQPSTPREPDATTLRNKMVYGVMAEIDYVYHDYETALFMNEGSFKVAGDVLQLGLSTASTITNGARAKTVLSAALTGVTGTTLSIDKNFFRQQTVQALVSSMQAGRDRIKTAILKRLDESASTYPFQAARSDLSAYFSAGTLPMALQQLNQTAAANAEVQRQLLSNVSLKDVDDATKLNHAVAEAFATKHLDKVVAFLKAMGVSVDETKPDDVEAKLRDLGRKTLADENLKKKYFDEARKAGLIQ